MIFLKVSVCVIMVMIAMETLRRSREISTDEELSRDKLRINFTSEWNQQQFQHVTYPSIAYDKNSTHFILPSSQSIGFDEINFDEEDAHNINSISTISTTLYMIKGPYLMLVYSTQTNSIVYERYGAISRDILFFQENNNLWVITCPSIKVLLVQVLNINTREILHSSKKLIEENVQLVRDIQVKDDHLEFQLITFSRNIIKLSYNLKTYSLHNRITRKTHLFEHLKIKFSDYFIRFPMEFFILEIRSYLNYVLHFITLGFLGENDSIREIRPVEDFHYFEALDPVDGLIIGMNLDHQYFKIQSLGNKLVPLRSPVFHSAQEMLLPVDEAFASSQTQEGKLDFVSFYGQQQHKRFSDMFGVYQVHPDANVHFFSFDKNYLYLNPQDNVSPDDFYMVRTQKGGLVMKGNEIKGVYDSLPINDERDPNIKYGFASDESYQQLTNNGQERMPYIFEAHLGYKGLFTIKRKNRIDLINGMNGQSMLSHYISKQGYAYSSSFIENNQLWIFEHSLNNSAVIYKYELFVNSTNPRTILYIKRGYPLEIQGQILGVQKCIDEFYYFDYVTHDQQSYGVARIHQSLLNNRKPLEDQKYAGQFEAMMVSQNFTKPNQFNIHPLEEEWFVVEMRVGKKTIQNWKLLKMRHQYFILPYRLFKVDNEYYFFNLRQLALSGFDAKRKWVQKMVYLGGFTLTLILGGICVVAVIGSSLSDRVKKEQKSQEEKTQNRIKESQKQRRQQLKNKKKSKRD